MKCLFIVAALAAIRVFVHLPQLPLHPSPQQMYQH